MMLVIAGADPSVRNVMKTHPANELAAEVLRQGGSLRIKARGGSMLPFLREGDVALVVPAAGMEIGVGDVICYETAPGRLFVHRVIERKRDRFVAKGDALRVTDVLERRQLVGKVVAIERRGRLTRLDTRASQWSSRAVALLSPLLPPLVSVAIQARRRWRALAC
jgi:signal peptidase I